MNTPTTEPVFTHLLAAAEILGVPPYLVRQMVDDGELPSRRIGARTYIPTAALRRLREEVSA